MIAVIQRVTEAAVRVNGEIVGQIGPGLLVLAAIHASDGADNIAWMAAKLVALRIFRQEEKHFDIDVQQAGGSILLVSNFTVAADVRKGRRPSFDAAAPPERGREMFDQLVEAVRRTGIPVETGRFGADMHVSLVNDGPSTFVLNSPANGQVRPPAPPRLAE